MRFYESIHMVHHGSPLVHPIVLHPPGLGISRSTVESRPGGKTTYLQDGAYEAVIGDSHSAPLHMLGTSRAPESLRVLYGLARNDFFLLRGPGVGEHTISKSWRMGRRPINPITYHHLSTHQPFRPVDNVFA